MSQSDSSQPDSAQSPADSSVVPLTNRGEQLGALDLGSNSFHLLVAQSNHDRVQVLDKHKEMVRLAAGLDEDNNLTDEAVERALECLQRFGQRLRTLAPENVRVVGTNTLRKARAPRFIREAEQILGHRIEIISGREEARLIYLGVCHDLGASDTRRLVVDIGGGSTEMIIGRRFQPENLASLYMGCVSMTQRHFKDGNITAEAMRHATKEAMIELEPVVASYKRAGWDTVVGTSGTINAVLSVVTAMFSVDAIALEQLLALERKLIKAGSVDALQLPGLSDERRPVFAGGVAILIAIFKALGIESMATSQSALREGLIFDLIGRHHQDDARDHTVDSLMQRYRIDRVQARQVRETAIGLLSQVALSWELTSPHCKRMISWAADLHEIGMDIAYSGFHKHGAYLIENLDMPGFSRADQQQLATLVRCHRRKLVRDLLPDTDPVIQRLAVLLRLASVLHRNRNPEPLPHVNAIAEGNELRLMIPDTWLEGHPLTAADLRNEAAYLTTLNISVTVNA